MFSHTLSRARKIQNNCMPLAICAHLVSRVHKFPVSRHVGQRNFYHGGQINRAAVLFLRTVWSRNTHGSIWSPIFDIPFLISRREKLKRRAAHFCSLKHIPKNLVNRKLPRPQEVPPLLVYFYLGIPCIPAGLSSAHRFLSSLPGGLLIATC